MHKIPETVYSRNVMPIITGILISIVCIVGSTIVTINNLVKEKTTVLLRPIAPPIGKKIFLERISFIWDKLKYSNKLTIRNIFRYKRRVFMSIFGIASCTMILLSGYGIKDSITYVVDKQYNEINHNDALIFLDGKLNADELDEITESERLEFNVYAKIDQVEVENKRLSFIIPDDDKKFKEALTLIDVKTKEEIDLKEDSVVVTSKLAKYFNKKVGDTITILESNNLTYEFKISNICENYIGDYIYATKDTYIKHIGDYKINTQYLKFKDLNQENEIMTNIKNNNTHILSTVSISTAKQQAETLFKSLNIIVYVLVIFSGALSFVVFYSLAYINLSERQREIATIKVLGFYNNEVDSYIMKEELIITILGILVGLVFGTLYAYSLIDSIEINTMQYIKSIHLDSYLQTFGFMILFTIIVSFGVHITLKKVDLIESLKSVE
jgi:putative ABC transport system permease protein